MVSAISFLILTNRIMLVMFIKYKHNKIHYATKKKGKKMSKNIDLIVLGDVTAVISRFIDLRKQLISLTADVTDQDFKDSLVDFDYTLLSGLQNLLFSVSSYERNIVTSWGNTK